LLKFTFIFFTLKETYSTYRKSSPNSESRDIPSSTILFTSSPLTAMLHLVSQSQNQNRNRNNQERTSSVLSSLVSSLQETRRDIEPDEDEEIF
jgi:hypothetical protein